MRLTPPMRLARLAAFLIAAQIVPIVLVGAASVVAQNAEERRLAQLDRLEAVRLANLELLTGLVEQESAVRGYVDTARAEFLQPFDGGGTQFESALVTLRSEASGGQRAQIETVAGRARLWQAWAAGRVTAVTAAGAPVIDVVEAQAGKALFDDFRAADQALADMLTVSEASADAGARRQAGQLSVLALVMLGLNLAIAIPAAAILVRRLVRPVRHLAVSATMIAAGRSAPLPHAQQKDEIGELARALEKWRRQSEARLDLARMMVDVSLRTDLSGVLELGCERLCSVLACEQVIVTVNSPGGPVLAAARPEPFGPGLYLPRSPGGEALRTGRPVFGNVEDGDWDPEILAWAAGLQLGPALSLPMWAGPDLVGAATVYRRAGDAPFAESDAQWAALMLPPLAAAVRSARLLDELAASNEALARADAHRSQFLANMSHELRTPLNSIIGFAELLLNRHSGSWGDPKAERFLEIIRTSGHGLLALVNDILDLSKISAGRVTLERRPVEVGPLVHEVLATLDPLLAEKGLRSSVAVAGDLVVDADPRLFRQVMVNLASNAIKFSAPGGTIAISARREAGEVTLSVADSGVGIAPEDQQRIFDDFEQVASAAAGRAKGTGLGLALVRRIVELHEGSITVASELGRGSTFTVHLPLEAGRGGLSPGLPAQLDPAGGIA